MSNQFIDAMNKEGNWKKTENEADALKSTTSSLLDLFGTIGALRTRSESDIQQLFSKAFTEDPLLAIKMSFYARNIRGGLGERRTPRTIWSFLAKVHPSIMKKNMHLIPEFGRWDDLYIFVDTVLENDFWQLVREQWVLDLEGMKSNKSISLMAKWLKSVNTSSNESKKLGKLTAKKLDLSESEYRKSLSSLRKYLDVVEQKMSSKYWGDINYEKVPSKAMMNYRKAFAKQDESRFAEYMEKVTKGEAKINSGTLFPYDIVEKVFRGEYNNVLEEQWKSLPNYVEGENNILIMADVSGSMEGRPLATSVGLAVYFAERNKGAFSNVFLTFSGQPEFVTLKGSTLYEKVNNAKNAHWDTNTDIERAFTLILNSAVNNNVPKEDMPKALVIISDMEFDESQRSYGRSKKTYITHMKEMFAEKGYELPRCVFWNVDARQTTFHAEENDQGVQFASGQSQSVFKSILKNVQLSAYELMLETLNDNVYDEVTI